MILWLVCACVRIRRVGRPNRLTLNALENRLIRTDTWDRVESTEPFHDQTSHWPASWIGILFEVYSDASVRFEKENLLCAFRLNKSDFGHVFPD